MNQISLLYPAGMEPPLLQQLTDEAVNDLSIDYICACLSHQATEQNLIKKIMIQLCDDPAVIRYRCDIFEDVLRFPVLRQHIAALLEQLDFLKMVERLSKDSDAPGIWQLINRLNELDHYIKCIEGIRDCLNGLDIQSQGFNDLKNFVDRIYQDSGFDYLKKDIAHLQENVCKIKSLTLGVNLDNQLRPIETGIVSINNEAYKKMGILRNLLDFTSSREEIHDGVSFTGMAPYHPPKVTADDKALKAGEAAADVMLPGRRALRQEDYGAQQIGANPLMNNLNLTITDMLQGVVRNLKTALSKYVNISGFALSAIISEFTFYLRWAELMDKIIEKGAPVCKPEILDTPRAFEGHGIYNFKLALQLVDGAELDIVQNELHFSDEHRVYILTGPNRGGKTTITQAVGLIYLLAQNGIYVPGEKVALCPADSLYTHFPADENQTVNLGRLGEESKRFSEIFSAATSRSLILLNESFATTSFTEGLYIAKDITKSLVYLGANAIFNTHMHELAADLDEINRSVGGVNRAASLVTGIDGGRRSYKITLAPPQGLSYAKDIAEKYGVTFRHLRDIIEKRKDPS